MAMWPLVDLEMREMKSVQIQADLHPKTRANDRTTRAQGDLVAGEKRVSEQWDSRKWASGDTKTGRK